MLSLLLRGASPAGACQQLGLSVGAFLRTVTEDEGFQKRAGDVIALLTGNVTAVLYRQAMEGSVPAQQAWLKTFPPPVWQQSPHRPVSAATFDETLEQLSDVELVELARAMGVDLPHQAETGVAAP